MMLHSMYRSQFIHFGNSFYMPLQLSYLGINFHKKLLQFNVQPILFRSLEMLPQEMIAALYPLKQMKEK